MKSHRPRKRFGQHFLCDPYTITSILNEINAAAEEYLVEIGPGTGVLTKRILENCKHLDAIEIDRDLAARLNKQLGQFPQLTIHNTDALKFSLASLNHPGKLRIFGNLPYNISTPLLFHLFDQLDCIADMIFMLQKEVVNRMAAEVGSKHYGRLSVMTQYFCTPHPLLDIGPEAFDPPPKVMSSIIRLDPLTDKSHPEAKNINQLTNLVKHAFMYRRKTIHNALQALINTDTLEHIGINPTLRPQQLSVADYVTIANQLAPL